MNEDLRVNFCFVNVDALCLPFSLSPTSEDPSPVYSVFQVLACDFHDRIVVSEFFYQHSYHEFKPNRKQVCNLLPAQPAFVAYHTANPSYHQLL